MDALFVVINIAFRNRLFVQNLRFLLVERHLTHTVDGVVGVVGLLRHTVLCSLHHHAASEDTAEVGTLDTVHQATCIDGQHSALFPIASSRIRLP